MRTAPVTSTWGKRCTRVSPSGDGAPPPRCEPAEAAEQRGAAEAEGQTGDTGRDAHPQRAAVARRPSGGRVDGSRLELRLGRLGIGELGVGEFGISELGVGEFGVGECRVVEIGGGIVDGLRRVEFVTAHGVLDSVGHGRVGLGSLVGAGRVGRGVHGVLQGDVVVCHHDPDRR